MCDMQLYMPACLNGQYGYCMQTLLPEDYLCPSGWGSFDCYTVRPDDYGVPQWTDRNLLLTDDTSAANHSITFDTALLTEGGPIESGL